MVTVGAFAAKTHLSELLDRVEEGEEIVITRRGAAIAKLVPYDRQRSTTELEALVQRIRSARRGKSLGGLTIKELTHGGHRY